MASKERHLLQLPEHILCKILGYVTYETIAKRRLVCRRFNMICRRKLNVGYYAAVKRHGELYRRVKAQLPRRQSKRSAHPLSRHNNMLSALDSRFSLLMITYSKYMNAGACCFIPGKVIDEADRVLRLVQASVDSMAGTEAPLVAIPDGEDLTELRDISSMAMDHFEEHITAGLGGGVHRALHRDAGSTSRVIADSASAYLMPFASESLEAQMQNAFDILSPNRSNNPFRSGPPVISGEKHSMTVPVAVFESLLTSVKESSAQRSGVLLGLERKVSELTRKIFDQDRVLREQRIMMSEQSSRLKSQDHRIGLLEGKTGLCVSPDVESGVFPSSSWAKPTKNMTKPSNMFLRPSCSSTNETKTASTIPPPDATANCPKDSSNSDNSFDYSVSRLKRSPDHPAAASCSSISDPFPASALAHKYPTLLSSPHHNFGTVSSSSLSREDSEQSRDIPNEQFLSFSTGRPSAMNFSNRSQFLLDAAGTSSSSDLPVPRRGNRMRCFQKTLDEDRRTRIDRILRKTGADVASAQAKRKNLSETALSSEDFRPSAKRSCNTAEGRVLERTFMGDHGFSAPNLTGQMSGDMAFVGRQFSSGLSVPFRMPFATGTDAVKADTKEDAKPETKTKANFQAKTKANVKPKTKANVQTNIKAHVKTKANAKTKAKANAKTKSKVEAPEEVPASLVQYSDDD